MLDENDSTTTEAAAETSTPETSPDPTPDGSPVADTPAPAVKKTARKTTRKAAGRTRKTAAAADEQLALPTDPDQPAPEASEALAAPAEPTEAGTTGTEGTAEDAPAAKKTAKRAAAKRTTAKKATTKKAAAKRTTKKTAERAADEAATEPVPVATQPEDEDEETTGEQVTGDETTADETTSDDTTDDRATAEPDAGEQTAGEQDAAAAGPTALLFKAPDPVAAPSRRRRARPRAEEPEEPEKPEDTVQAGPEEQTAGDQGEAPTDRDTDASDDDTESDDEQTGTRRRRRRGGRRRRKSGGGDTNGSDNGPDNGPENGADNGADNSSDSGSGNGEASDQRDSGGNGGNGPKQGENGSGDEGSSSEGTGTRRRRRRRRSGEDGGDSGSDDPEKTVTRVRRTRSAEDEITALSGSTRLEAKKQRRREGREAGRRRAPIVSEAEFLARREAVDRVMVIRQRKDLTQIAVLEDDVLVEHYVARESQTSLIGNVYLGRVQNVLPSMEAAFVDIGKGRNAVLYAGEVNWDALGAGNGPRKIEQVLKSGQAILVQVTKDPIGHKGARLTSQVSLPGRFLVYVPDGTTSGISRKLPDTERTRLKTLLKEIVPDSAGVIVRTAAEGASEEELTKDVERLTARWTDIESKVAKGNAPQLLYGEPDLTLKVVRDLFTEDFGKLVVSGDEAWDMVDGYVEHVAPDLADRLERYSGEDVFGDYRIDEQIAKGLDRKVWLPSGGSLIIDRTEAMTVVDVNTGKFTGSGGNLEETVTKNNLEAAEEMVRQLRLRDIGGIIVIDFIDMVLESNRDLVLRRLVECLGRDRTRHQVAEVTSLGLVQMTRKRIGTGLLEAFSETCEHCQGRGLLVSHEPVEPRGKQQDEEPRRARRGRSRGGDGAPAGGPNGGKPASPSPKDIAAMARHEHKPADEQPGQPDGAGETSAAEQPTEAPASSPEQPAAEAAGEQAATVTPEGTSPVETPPETQAESPAETPVERPAESTVETSTEAPAEAPSETDDETPVEPPVPAGPRLVTSSRRRVARRPAGPPAGATGDSPEAGATTDTDGAADTAADTGTAGTATATVSPSDVPTGGDEANVAVTSEEPSVDGDSAETAHVPIKKKGSRKR